MHRTVSTHRRKKRRKEKKNNLTLECLHPTHHIHCCPLVPAGTTGFYHKNIPIIHLEQDSVWCFSMLSIVYLKVVLRTLAPPLYLSQADVVDAMGWIK